MCYIKYICSTILHVLYINYTLIFHIELTPQEELNNKLIDRLPTQKLLKMY